MKMILYTASRCPKCPKARKVVREAAAELGMVEGKDFVEKIIDGQDLQPGQAELEHENYNFFKTAEEINATPAALVADDFMIEALMFNVASTPSIIIGQEAVFKGAIPTKEELISAIKSA